MIIKHRVTGDTLLEVPGDTLRGAYLAHANLAHANLAHANLEGANLRGADLARADLRGANLARAYLAHANLAHANLAHAYLRDANLVGANLRDANLEGANLRVANLEGADLRDANLAGANLAGANLRGASLRGANLRGAVLPAAWADRPDPATLRLAVAAHIEAHPELHDQAKWGDGTPDAACGSACCVAGWACHLGGGDRGVGVMTAAQILLALPGAPLPDFSAQASREGILAALRTVPGAV